MSRSLLKSSFWYVVSGFLSKSVVLFMMPLYVRLLTKGQYGDYSNFVSWLTVFSTTALMNLQFLIIRDHSTSREANDQLLTNTYLAILLVSSPLILPLIFAPRLVGQMLIITPGEAWAMVLYLISVPLFHLVTARMRASYAIKSFVASNLIVAVTAAVSSIALMFLFPAHRLEAFIAGQTAPFIVAGLILTGLSVHTIPRPSWEKMKRVLGLGLPMIPHILGITVISRINRVMVYNLLGAEATGDFALVANLLLILTTLSTALVQAYTPWLTRRLADGQFELVGRVSGAQIALFYYFIAGLAFLAPEVLLFWGGRAYSNVLPLLPPLLISAGFTHMQTLLVNVEFFYESKRTLIYSTFLAAAVNVGLNLWALPRWGTSGAAYTTLASTLLLYALHDRAVRRLGKGMLIAPQIAYSGGALMMALLALMPFVYAHSALRYSCVALGLLLTLAGGLWVMKNLKKLQGVISS